MDGLQLQRIDADSGEIVQLLQDAGKRPCTPTAWLFSPRTVLQLLCIALNDNLTRHACEEPARQSHGPIDALPALSHPGMAVVAAGGHLSSQVITSSYSPFTLAYRLTWIVHTGGLVPGEAPDMHLVDDQVFKRCVERVVPLPVKGVLGARHRACMLGPCASPPQRPARPTLDVLHGSPRFRAAGTPGQPQCPTSLKWRS